MGTLPIGSTLLAITERVMTMKIVKKKINLGFNFDISRISKDLRIATAASDKVAEAFNKKAIKLLAYC